MAHGSAVYNDMMSSVSYKNYMKRKINILGIIYSFESLCIEENMIKTLKKAEKIIAFNKDRNLSLYGRVQVLKTKVIPLFFMKMQCLPMKNYIKRIENMLFKFVWNQYGEELVERNQIICEYTDGGLNMVDFASRYKAAVTFKLKEIANATNKSEFWIKFAYYNIGSTLRNINLNLYSNSEPHMTTADSYWSEVKLTFELISETLDWQVIKFKDLYKVFKAKVELPKLSKPWRNIHLMKIFKHHFTNVERQISYLIANDALRFGQYKRQNTPFIDIQTWNSFNCKFCNAHNDNILHLLNPDCVVMKQVFLMTKHFFKFVIKRDIDLNEKLIMHNDIPLKNNVDGTVEEEKLSLMKLKLVAVLKRVMIEEKEQCDRYKNVISVDQRLDFINKLLSKVKNKFMIFYNNYL